MELQEKLLVKTAPFHHAIENGPELVSCYDYLRRCFSEHENSPQMASSSNRRIMLFQMHLHFWNRLACETLNNYKFNQFLKKSDGKQFQFLKKLADGKFTEIHISFQSGVELMLLHLQANPKTYYPFIKGEPPIKTIKPFWIGIITAIMENPLFTKEHIRKLISINFDEIYQLLADEYLEPCFETGIALLRLHMLACTKCYTRRINI